MVTATADSTIRPNVHNNPTVSPLFFSLSSGRGGFMLGPRAADLGRGRVPPSLRSAYPAHARPPPVEVGVAVELAFDVHRPVPHPGHAACPPVKGRLVPSDAELVHTGLPYLYLL